MYLSRAIHYNPEEHTFVCYFYNEEGAVTDHYSGFYEETNGVMVYYDENHVWLDLEDNNPEDGGIIPVE